jgi:hypothetical protein
MSRQHQRLFPENGHADMMSAIAQMRWLEKVT